MVEADAPSNSIIYHITATIQYNEDPSILNCIINGNLSIVLKNIFQFSPETIIMEKAKKYISDEQYDAATELLQKINTEEAKTAIEGINFIDYAERFSDTSVWQLSDCLYLTMLGCTLDFDYDPVAYTFTMMIQIPGYWESLAYYAAEDENQFGDNVPYDEAKALYEKFSADGYSGVTCRVLIHNSANEILDEGFYSNGSSSPSKNNGEPSYSADDFPPTLPPIDPNDPNADIYSDYLGRYINQEGFVLEIGLGTSYGEYYYALIFENLAAAQNYEPPIVELTGGELNYGNDAMSIWFNDGYNDILFTRFPYWDEENLTFDMEGISSPYAQSTYYMIERSINPMG